MAHEPRGTTDFVAKKEHVKEEWKDSKPSNYMLYIHKHLKNEKDRVNNTKEW